MAKSSRLSVICRVCAISALAFVLTFGPVAQAAWTEPGPGVIPADNNVPRPLNVETNFQGDVTGLWNNLTINTAGPCNSGDILSWDGDSWECGSGGGNIGLLEVLNNDSDASSYDGTIQIGDDIDPSAKLLINTDLNPYSSPLVVNGLNNLVSFSVVGGSFGGLITNNSSGAAALAYQDTGVWGMGDQYGVRGGVPNTGTPIGADAAAIYGESTNANAYAGYFKGGKGVNIDDSNLKINGIGGTQQRINLLGDNSNPSIELYHLGAQTVNLASFGDSYFNGGNVGIGTELPRYKAEIVADGTDVNLGVLNTNYDTAAPWSTAGIHIGIGVNASNQYNAGTRLFQEGVWSAQSINGVGNVFVLDNSDDPDGSFSFRTRKTNESTAERLFVGSNGVRVENSLRVNGTSDFEGKVSIQDGTEAAGRVLVSDASGLASWTDPGTINAGGGTTYSAGTNIDATRLADPINEIDIIDNPTFTGSAAIGSGTLNANAQLKVDQGNKAVGIQLINSAGTAQQSIVSTVESNTQAQVIFNVDRAVAANDSNWAVGTWSNAIANTNGKFFIYDLKTAETRFSIDKNGNVGVGHASADAINQLFEVTDSSDTAVISRVRVTDNNNNPELQLQYGPTSGSDHWGIFSDQANGDSLNFWSYNGGASGNRLTVLQNGNIGIGDVTPASLFTVGNGDLFQVNTAGDLIRIKNIAYAWPSAQGAAGTVLTNNGTGGLSWAPATGGATYTAETNIDGTKLAAGIIDVIDAPTFAGNVVINGQQLNHLADNDFYINSDGGLQLRMNADNDGVGTGSMAVNNSLNTTVLRVTDSGRVGIGTGAGTAFNLSNLVVAGSDVNDVPGLQIANNQPALAGTDPKSSIIFTRGSYNNAAQRQAMISSGAGATNFGVGYLSFYTNNGGLSERMRIDKDGNIGIANSAPTAKLDITGNIKINDGTAGPGKVLAAIDSTGLAHWENASTVISTGGWRWKAGPGDQTCGTFDGDYNPADYVVNNVELLRMIQFFNIGFYYPLTGTEDGFQPTSDGGDVVTYIQNNISNLIYHDADINHDYKIDLSELQRIIQYFNIGQYSCI